MTRFSDDPTRTAADPSAVLRSQLDAAAGRWRREWLWQALARLGMVLAGIFVFWAGLAAARPEWARDWPVGALVAGGSVLFVILESRLREPDWPRIRRRVDQRLGLPDAVLTAAELLETESEPGSPAAEWRTRQLSQTAERLSQADWRQAWPVRVTRRTPLAYLVAMLALGFLGWRFAEWRIRTLPPPPTAAERETARALREVFDDWDKSEREQPDPELKQLLDELKPLRERLAQKDAALNEREAFAQISRVEDKLAAAQAKLDAQSLKPLAADMAAAFEKVDGQSALAAALRRNDFQNAEAEAEKSAAQMQKADAAAPPQGAQAAEAAQRFDKLAQQFGQKGNEGAQQSMSQMKEGLQKQQASQMGKGMQGLKQSLAGQNGRDAQKRNLALQRRQMGAGKDGLGKGKDPGMGMSLVPKLSLQRSKEPGKGASSEVDPNRVGAASALAADRHEETLGGNANDQGESETKTISTLDPSQERAGAATAANFRAYEALSRQAVTDENLPLAHRQTIKRYFESIRPAPEKP